MKVTLIDFTGAGNGDPDYAAKLLVYVKNTRLSQNSERWKDAQHIGAKELARELTAIALTIRSSWEFVTMTFQVENVSRAFTHQFVRTRTASYAQQAQRATDMSDFAALYPDRLASEMEPTWTETLEIIRDAYRELIAKGLPPEDARGLLPNATLTNIIMHCNLRTLADLVAKRDNARAQGEYVSVIRAMVEEVFKVMPWTRQFLYPERTATPALDRILDAVRAGATPTSRPELNDALKELDRLRGTWG